MISLPDLSDQHSDQIQIGKLALKSFGGMHSISGEIYTVSCSDDNSVVKDILSSKGKKKVLVIDASGVTAITAGTAADVVALINDSTVTLATDVAVTVTGTAAATDLTAIATATSGTITASGVTSITGTAATISAATRTV